MGSVWPHTPFYTTMGSWTGSFWEPAHVSTSFKTEQKSQHETAGPRWQIAFITSELFCYGALCFLSKLMTRPLASRFAPIFWFEPKGRRVDMWSEWPSWYLIRMALYVPKIWFRDQNKTFSLLVGKVNGTFGSWCRVADLCWCFSAHRDCKEW